jgi:hypothetical protein
MPSSPSSPSRQLRSPVPAASSNLGKLPSSPLRDGRNPGLLLAMCDWSSPSNSVPILAELLSEKAIRSGKNLEAVVIDMLEAGVKR